MPDTLLFKTTLSDRFLYLDSMFQLKSNGAYMERIGIPEFDNIDFSLSYSQKIDIGNKSYINFVSNNKKIIVYFMNSYYHFISDYIDWVYQIIEENRECEIIFYSEYEHDKFPQYVQYFLNKLDELKIKYYIVFKTDETVLINNFYIYNYGFYMLNKKTILNIEKFFDVDNKNKPLKKVYLSRKNFQNRVRINDEDKLEKYFYNNGFEIIRPDEFLNFSEQIKYFNDVKLLVSSTSGGLTNEFFMPSGSTVLELTTPMIGLDIDNNEETAFVHHFYSTIAFLKNHTYISISNYNNNPGDIIDYIENSEILKKVISNE